MFVSKAFSYFITAIGMSTLVALAACGSQTTSTDPETTSLAALDAGENPNGTGNPNGNAGNPNGNAGNPNGTAQCTLQGNVWVGNCPAGQMCLNYFQCVDIVHATPCGLSTGDSWVCSDPNGAVVAVVSPSAMDPNGIGFTPPSNCQIQTVSGTPGGTCAANEVCTQAGPAAAPNPVCANAAVVAP